MSIYKQNLNKIVLMVYNLFDINKDFGIKAI